MGQEEILLAQALYPVVNGGGERDYPTREVSEEAEEVADEDIDADAEDVRSLEGHGYPLRRLRKDL